MSNNVYGRLMHTTAGLSIEYHDDRRALRVGDVIEIVVRGRRSKARIAMMASTGATVVVNGCGAIEDGLAFAERCSRLLADVRWITYEPTIAAAR